MSKNQPDTRNVDTTRVSPISYDYAHKKLKRARGSAYEYECVECGRQASQWAYQPGGPYEQSETVTKTIRGERKEMHLVWSADVFAYLPKCVPCHRLQDNKRGDA